MKNFFLIIIFFSIQNYSQELLLHYTFDGNVNDVSGNNFNGNPSGVTYVNDRNGNANSAVSFDGINDFIDFPNVLKLKPTLPVSFSFWIKYESDNVQDRVVFNTSFKEDVNSGVYLTSQSSTGKLAVGYGDGSSSFTSSNRRGYLSNNVIKSNAWHQIHIVILSSNNIKVYLDCVETGGTYSGFGSKLSYSSNPGSLGRHDQNSSGIASYYFKGVLDDFKYYKGEIIPTVKNTTFINLPTKLCENSTFSLPTTSANGIVGTWSPAFNSTTLGIKNYTFKPNTGQCATSFNHSIEITNNLTPSFSNLPKELCENSTFSLPTTSANGIVGTWSPAFDSTTLGTKNYTFEPNTGQCANSFNHSIEVTVNRAPNFSDLPKELCENSTFSLPTTSTNGITGTWSPAFDSTTLGTKNYTFEPDTGQCANSFNHSIEVTVNRAPNFSDLPKELCENSNFSLPTTSTNGITGTWSPVFNNSLIGTTVYTFISDSGKCRNNFTHSIKIVKELKPNFASLPKEIFKGDVYVLPKVSDNGLSGNWFPKFNNNLIGTSKYIFTPNQSCGSIFVSNIKIIERIDLDIPSFFTPNGDNINDFWLIEGIDNYKDVKISIFNRYGKFLIKVNPLIGWDGSYMNKKMPSDDYWYLLEVLDLSNKALFIRGHFSLLRK
ncbi:T9SS type B sorting domain-containing protein [Polaribacter aestuariivivens]|uniref:T9SS type B sorting domain-containing protein n=1 Tax=Polaribacter aestuariivivens TaxID=2304626 RepID=A0A5S3NDZ6_9FLAO|nr:T9SS type B sorting domain-containing protein [Polaribacter aestuariivivens]TMM31979.1 T9SS type B sorting domain-containing protein [Polaribacter aestuariivivens]